jgi:hypothetical protein
VIKTAGDAAGKTRRAEAKKSPPLKGNRWLWLKSPAALTDEELKTLTSLRGGSLKTAKAYKIKAALQDIYK